MIMEEIWVPIPGYEDLYQASNLGRIRSVDCVREYFAFGKQVQRYHKGRILKQKLDGRGFYLQVSLCKNGKNIICLVHRLVASAFIENPNNYPEVNHKDENKRNNAAQNLEWCTHEYNNNYGSKKFASNGENNSMSKLSESEVREIRRVYKHRDKDFGLLALSQKYGISPSHVHSIVNGRRWGWLE